MQYLLWSVYMRVVVVVVSAVVVVPHCPVSTACCSLILWFLCAVCSRGAPPPPQPGHRGVCCYLHCREMENTCEGGLLGVAPEAQVRSPGPHSALQALRDGDQHLGTTVRLPLFNSFSSVYCDGLTLSQKRWHLLPGSMLTGLTRRPPLSASPQARGWSQWKSAC